MKQTDKMKKNFFEKMILLSDQKKRGLSSFRISCNFGNF